MHFDVTKREKIFISKTQHTTFNGFPFFTRTYRILWKSCPKILRSPVKCLLTKGAIFIAVQSDASMNSGQHYYSYSLFSFAPQYNTCAQLIWLLKLAVVILIQSLTCISLIYYFLFPHIMSFEMDQSVSHVLVLQLVHIIDSQIIFWFVTEEIDFNRESKINIFFTFQKSLIINHKHTLFVCTPRKQIQIYSSIFH